MGKGKDKSGAPSAVEAKVEDLNARVRWLEACACVLQEEIDRIRGDVARLETEMGAEP